MATAVYFSITCRNCYATLLWKHKCSASPVKSCLFKTALTFTFMLYCLY